MSVLDGVASALFVHAHPDDETLSTGALIAELVARGVRVGVVTASRGERGEVVAGPLSSLEGTPELTAHREGELAGALASLGVPWHAWIGLPPARAAGLAPRVYRDSGMRWVCEGQAGPAEDVDDDALTRAPLEEVAADLAAAIASFGPDLVVGYDDNGGYGHPDHVRAREAARAACDSLGVRFAEVVGRREDAAGDAAAEWLELGHRLPDVVAALRHHASQLTVDGVEVVHSGGQCEAITTSIGLRILAPEE